MPEFLVTVEVRVEADDARSAEEMVGYTLCHAGWDVESGVAELLDDDDLVDDDEDLLAVFEEDR